MDNKKINDTNEINSTNEQNKLEIANSEEGENESEIFDSEEEEAEYKSLINPEAVQKFQKEFKETGIKLVFFSSLSYLYSSEIIYLILSPIFILLGIFIVNSCLSKIVKGEKEDGVLTRLWLKSLYIGNLLSVANFIVVCLSTFLLLVIIPLIVLHFEKNSFTLIKNFIPFVLTAFLPLWFFLKLNLIEKNYLRIINKRVLRDFPTFVSVIIWIFAIIVFLRNVNSLGTIVVTSIPNLIYRYN